MKKILVALAIGLFSATSQAAYLYWQVSQDDIEKAHLVDGSSVTHADLYVIDMSSSSAEAKKLGTYKVGGDEHVNIDVSNYAAGNYAFYIEVYNWSRGSESVLGTSYSDITNNTYEQLAVKHYIGTTLDVPTLKVWHGGAVAAPEPTTGLLMLFGLAGLALKRRKI